MNGKKQHVTLYLVSVDMNSTNLFSSFPQMRESILFNVFLDARLCRGMTGQFKWDSSGSAPFYQVIKA